MIKKIRANQIAIQALRTRKYLSATANSPICPYNLADAMGFDIRFVKISSFEGMYLADENMILVSAERPEGRKSFTCAHELGHHVLEHGTIIDEIIESGSNKEIEREADFFAAMLLMPLSVVKRAAHDIGINFDTITHEQIYILSKYLGVSYAAMNYQMHFNLKLINYAIYEQLKKVNLREVKNKLLPNKTDGEIFIVSGWWQGRAIDVAVGDSIVVDNFSELEGLAILKITDALNSNVFEAVKLGIAKISNTTGWSAFVRVSRKQFVGMYQFMHEEEVE
jgi:Zn-dependent peptidase ImmA (M78 family)